MTEPLEFTGTFEKLIYQNRETAWSVGSLVSRGYHLPIIFVGHFPTAQVGQELHITGSWQEHPKFGRQFLIDRYDVLLPTEEDGMEAYLGSGFIKGIGPALAKRLVQKFGKEIFNVMDSDIEQLRSVSGIGVHKLARIKACWQENRDLRALIAFMQGYHIPKNLVLKIYRSYGHRALEVLRHNPYQLAIDVSGIGFHKADEIAQALGIAADSPFRIQAALLYTLEHALHQGHSYLPEPLLLEEARRYLGQVEPGAIIPILGELIAIHGQCVATALNDDRAISLRATYQCEQAIARELKRLCSDSLLSAHDSPTPRYFSPSQQRAIRAALNSKLLVITGGPGTGKTTIIKALLDFFKTHKKSVMLAAPTGRAAARMQEASAHEAKTIHRLLDYQAALGAFGKSADNPLEADVIIIDESSMLDIFLARALLEAIPSATQCIFVGDANQLPPVGPGNFLRDVIASSAVPVVELTDIFRQGENSLIIENAHAILNGNLPREATIPERLSDFYFIELETVDEILQMMKRLITERIPKRFHIPRHEIQVLTPMNRGPLGTQALNIHLQTWLNPVATTHGTFLIGDRVMQLRNNYDLEVFNGDIGTIHSYDAEAGELEVNYDGRLVGYSAKEWDELGLAYATTVHKSQGSEYAAILFPLVTHHYIMLQRNLIYTALTRAKRLAIFIGSKKALEIGLKKIGGTRRYSMLQHWLRPSSPQIPE